MKPLMLYDFPFSMNRSRTSSWSFIYHSDFSFKSDSLRSHLLVSFYFLKDTGLIYNGFSIFLLSLNFMIISKYNTKFFLCSLIISIFLRFPLIFKKEVFPILPEFSFQYDLFFISDLSHQPINEVK
jgi:hypothetical protein